MPHPDDITALETQFEAVENDARALVSGLDERRGGWRETAGSWSVAECLDHLATSNRIYLGAMKGAAAAAKEKGRMRRGPAAPGFAGRWFARSLEPPVSFKAPAPKAIRPRTAPSLAGAAASFFAEHAAAREFLDRYADLDLAGVTFPNPLLRGAPFSLATGLHVIAAHERRHLWQGWRVRKAAEAAG